MSPASLLADPVTLGETCDASRKGTLPAGGCVDPGTHPPHVPKDYTARSLYGTGTATNSERFPLLFFKEMSSFCCFTFLYGVSSTK